MANGLVKYEARDGQEISLSFDIVKKYLVQGRSEYVTDQELMYFMGVCKSRGLNPFIKDAYLIKYSQKDGAAIVTSRDYFRKRAKAQKDCQGWGFGCIVRRNGEIILTNGLVLEDDELLGGWFEALPDGWKTPLKLEVNLKGYLKHKQDGGLTSFWKKENQPTQIAKVAESQGLRACWPDEFQNLYGPEEILTGDTIDVTEASKLTADALKERMKNEQDKATEEEAPPPPGENTGQAPESQPEGKSGRKTPVYINDDTKLTIPKLCHELGLDTLEVIGEVTGKKILGKLTPEEGIQVLEHLGKTPELPPTEKVDAGPDPGTDSQELEEWTLTPTLINDPKIDTNELFNRLSRYPSLTQAHIDEISKIIDTGDYTVKNLFDTAGDFESMQNYLETVIEPRLIK